MDRSFTQPVIIPQNHGLMAVRTIRDCMIAGAGAVAQVESGRKGGGFANDGPERLGVLMCLGLMYFLK
ncbi:hypothetical protein A7X99_17670 [Stenotrophomonas maltophilia]|nr:hypothetical protein C7E12_01655 [Stenotrophomonas maltophilia]PZS96208.1 hypothetical protein A7X90_08540 [Stenotrophomonas maltophilia]PZT45841.1 hypothetical protein A7X99_17670 [Stenotrophomonas maltophilia]